MPSVNTSRTLLVLAILANLLAMSGGGSVLPPFKTFPFFTTPTSIAGIYGTCPMNFDQTFHTLDSDWKELQDQCQTMFTNFDSTAIRLLPRDEIMISGLHIMSFLLATIALLSFNKRNTTGGTVFAVSATTVQAIAVGLAIWHFWEYQDQGKYGLGMYVDCASVGLLLLASLISWPSKREHFEKWNA
jgi:hypothetical protein